MSGGADGSGSTESTESTERTESTDVVAEVRRACRRVAAESVHVTIDDERLDSFARSIATDGARGPSVDPDYFFLGGPEETAAYVLTFTAVNFGSGWHPHVRKVPGRSGSITMMTRLTERFRRGGPIGAEELAAMTPGRAAVIFDQPLDPPVDELMALFARGLSQLGRLLLDGFDGSVAALIESAEHSAVRLAGVLLAMPMFADVATYHGFAVPMLKRAQIAGADLSAALGGQGLGRFDDLDRLTIFADNLVPHVLRVEGVLRYRAELVARIDAGELIPAGSEEEVEMRACAVESVERMVALLRAEGHAVTAVGLDYVLWSSGQAPRYKARPRHRTRTWFY
ncbi:MAG TPA: queuosine salvage family protein [Acidimicrobiales bacterium]|nr:queuosine salvage family protein [Acidimicrobiales bacterium]